ncbi:MAG: metallophosphoesterase [Brevinematales bacterium]|nr:metallophosphoesterase [Brevinematales bacterium]
MKIALISDLHVAASLPWTQQVWEAFLSRVEEENISLVVVGGDLFDSLDDAYTLRQWLAHSVDKTRISRLLWIVGNHDLTNPTTGKQVYRLADMNFGEKVEVCLTPDLWVEDGIEIMGYPFPLVRTEEEREAFSPSKLLSRFPSPEQRRIAVAHVGLASWVPHMSEEAEVIPKTFATMFQCERVFLGHIHQRLEDGVYRTLGSARVWRKGESGEHGYLVYDTETHTERFENLPEGRVFQEKEVFVFYDQVEDREEKPFSSHTWLHFDLYGVVQNDAQKEKIKDHLRQKYTNVAEITFDEEGLFLSSVLANHPVWQIFLSKWEKHYEASPEEEKSLWLLAREIFVKDFLQQGGRG